MTLVVARNINGFFRIISDTKITNKDAVRNDSTAARVKSLILSPSTCLSYAGDVYFAELVIDLFYEKKLKTVKELILNCLKSNRESKNKTEFLISVIVEGQPNLYKISNYKIEHEPEVSWIGHKGAFSEYQRVFHGNEEEKDVFNNMELAFAQVISNESLPEVSGFQTGVEAVYQKETGLVFFIYTHKSRIEIAPFTRKGRKGKNSFTVPFGTAAVGGYGISYLRSVTILKAGFLIYFLQGGFGLFFCPKENRDKPILIRNEDGESLAIYIRKRYEVSLEGMIATSDNALKMIRT